MGTVYSHWHDSWSCYHFRAGVGQLVSVFLHALQYSSLSGQMQWQILEYVTEDLTSENWQQNACHGLFKEWTMSSVRPSNSGCTRIVGRARRCLSALPTIQVHPELDGRTLDIVHCVYNMERHFSRWKFPFSALIKLQILRVHVHVLFSLHVHVHVLSSPVALSLCWSFDASDVSAAISDTFFLNLQSHRETLTQMLDNTLVTAKVMFYSKRVARKNFCWQEISPTMTSAWTIPMNHPFLFHKK